MVATMSLVIKVFQVFNLHRWSLWHVLCGDAGLVDRIQMYLSRLAPVCRIEPMIKRWEVSVWVICGACCGFMATFLVILGGLGVILGGLGVPLGCFWEPLGVIWELLGGLWLLFWCFVSENVKL